MATNTKLNALFGYPEQIWNAVLATMGYASSTLQTANQNTALSLAQACAATFKNAISDIDAFTIAAAAANSYTLLEPVLTLALSLSPQDVAYITNRANALRQLSLGLASTTTNPVRDIPAALAAGQPAIPDCGLTVFLLNYRNNAGTQYTPEVAPIGLTTVNFAENALNSAIAWDNFYAAVINSTMVSGAALNQIAYMAESSHIAADIVARLPIDTNDAMFIIECWDRMVATPTLSRFSFANANNPVSVIAQQIAVARLVCLQALYQFDLLVVNLQKIVPPNVSTYTIRFGDSLMGISATQLGDYTIWEQIATINGLVPPYISDTPNIPNVAYPGKQIYLPSNGPPPISIPAVSPASYEVSFLGYDLFYGSLNQDMLSWTGDFQVISGYQNLAFSLGRRLQTPLSNLIYHLSFGSRIPGEVGNIATQDTVSHISAYAISAVLTDPRVQQIVSSQALPLTNQGVSVSMTVLPKGQTSANSVPVGQTFPGVPVS